MEKRLLNLYLKNLKSQNESVWKKIVKLPRGIVAQLVVSLVLLVIALVFAILFSAEISLQGWKTICAIVYIVLVSISFTLCFTALSATGKYEIEISDNSMDEYWKRCKANEEWIKNELSLSDANITDDILQIKQRIEAQRNAITSEADKKAERTDKWLQALAVPFVLAIFTAIIDKNDDVINAISTVFAILIVGFGFYGFVLLINNVLNLFRKQKVEKLKLFADELQGIIDMHQYHKNKDDRKG